MFPLGLPFTFRTSFWPLLVAAAFIASCGKDQPVPETSVSGSVKDTFGGSLDSAAVKFEGPQGTYQSTSDASGSFTLKGVKTGNYQVSVSKKFYLPVERPQAVAVGQTPFEFTLSPGNAFLRVGDSVKLVPVNGGYYGIRVESNAEWKVKSDNNWLTFDAGSGAGKGYLFFTCPPSREINDRIAVVTVSSGSITRRIRVTQLAALQVISTKGIIGNTITGVEDSVRITFNRTPRLNGVTADYTLCSRGISPVLKGNTISFAYPCGSVGEGFPFTVDVSDTFDRYTLKVRVPFHQAETDINGLVDFFFSGDDKYLWILTSGDAGVQTGSVRKLALPDLTTVATYPLDFNPLNMQWNEFLNAITLFGEETNCTYEQIVDGSCRYNYLYHLNPGSGTLTRSRITLLPGYDADYFNYPYVFPKSLAVFEDGRGVIGLSSLYGSRSWRMIDEGQKDSTWVTAYHQNFTDIKYQRVFSNYDHTRIYLMHPDGSNRIDILEQGAQTFRTFESPVFDRGFRLIAHPSRNLMFHGQLYSQFISDLEGAVSKVSYLDMRYSYLGLSFTRRPQEDQCIYLSGDGEIKVMDYRIGTTPLLTKISETVTKLAVTSDGKYLAALKNSSGLSGNLVLIDADLLNRYRLPVSGRTVLTTDRKMQADWLPR